MRMQYVLRQALGRSAFEPPEWEPSEPLPDATRLDPTATTSEILGRENGYVQQYDSRGHPENRRSKAAARRFRKAQNDVLTTIGVCVVVDSQGRISQKKSRQPDVVAKQIAAIEKENRFGLGLAMADDIVFHVSSLFLENLRTRLQTFSTYSRIPLLLIDRTEYSSLGTFTYLCAGGLATLTYLSLEILWESLMAHTAELLFEFVERSSLTPKRKEQANRVIDVAERLMTWTGQVLLSPLEIFGTLQGLGIVPAWPLLPKPTSWSARALYGSLMPVLPARWTGRSSWSFFMAAATSPVVLWALRDRFYVSLGSKVNKYFAIVIPRPGFPDQSSIQAANGCRWVQLHEVLSARRGSIWSEVRKDFRPVFRGLQLLRTLLARASSWPDVSLLGGTDQSGTLPIVPLPSSFLSPSRTLVDEPGSLEFSLETTDPTSPTPRSDSSGASRRPSHSTSSRPQTPTARANNVHITTRHGSSDTLHMQVELSATSAGAPIVTSAFSTSPHPGVVMTAAASTPHSTIGSPQLPYEPLSSHPPDRSIPPQAAPHGRHPQAPRYRISFLSIFPADSLAKHLSYATMTLLRLPLDALFYRTVALAFAARLGTTAFEADVAHSRTKHVYPRHVWFGGAAEWNSMSDYAAKMCACVGIELALAYSLWRVGTGISIWAGRNLYGWEML